MGELLNQLRDWVESVILAFGYVGVTLLMLLENIVPPIPSEVVLPFTGFLVGSGALSFAGVLVAATLGSVLGALMLYALGRYAGEPLIRGILRRYGGLLRVSEADLDRALTLFARHGTIIVFVGRLIPLIRSLISIPAGMQRMSMPVFLLYTTLGSAVWSGALIYAGVLLGARWEDVIGFVETYQRWVLVALAAGVMLIVARYLKLFGGATSKAS